MLTFSNWQKASNHRIEKIGKKPEVVIAKLGDLSNMTVADIGAGTGYFSFRLAEKAEKVISIDIDERFLNYIENKKESLKNAANLNI